MRSGNSRGLVTRFKELVAIFKETFPKWNSHDPFSNSVIISYYTIFSLPGLLVIVINLAGYFYGKDEVTAAVVEQIHGTIGGNTANDINAMLTKATETKATTISTILGVATLIFGATGVFYQLQQVLNRMWEVKPNPEKKILKIIRDRIFSFGLVLAVGFLLLVSLTLSAALNAVGNWISGNFSDALVVVFDVIDVAVSIGVFTLLFAAIFKFLPDAKISWRDVWHGAFVTALLFAIAKFALGIYFAKSNPSSAYGAAGTIVLIMLWVSYAGLIVLFGAQFTQTYAMHSGKKIAPVKGAVSTTAQAK
jgi:membrane protein